MAASSVNNGMCCRGPRFHLQKDAQAIQASMNAAVACARLTSYELNTHIANVPASGGNASSRCVDAPGVATDLFSNCMQASYSNGGFKTIDKSLNCRLD